MTWRWPYPIAILAVAVALAGVTAAATRPPETVTLTNSACGDGWSGPVDGRQTVTVTDESRDPVQVYLIDPRRNTVFAEARDVAAGTSRDIETTLGGGTYALRCVFSNGDIGTSRSFTVTGPHTSAGIAPLPDLDLDQPVQAYRGYVQASLPKLRTAAEVLDADVAANDLTRARRDWLPAHLDYERLGAAYNTFEDFDADLNATADGLARGVDDPSWTGFFRLEYGLWHSQSAAELTPIANRLVADVNGLIKDFPSEDTDPVDLPLRSHEILENALEFQVTGDADYGSHTTLDTVAANIRGTQEVLSTLAALIDAREPALLPRIDGLIATVQADLTSATRADDSAATTRASRTGVGPQAGGASDTSLRARQRLDGDLGELLEVLAIIPNLLQERTSA
jgi:iron uptake system EfeUOB component EfeO/EfeM